MQWKLLEPPAKSALLFLRYCNKVSWNNPEHSSTVPSDKNLSEQIVQAVTCKHFQDMKCKCLFVKRTNCFLLCRNMFASLNFHCPYPCPLQHKYLVFDSRLAVLWMPFKMPLLVEKRKMWCYNLANNTYAYNSGLKPSMNEVSEKCEDFLCFHPGKEL